MKNLLTICFVIISLSLFAQDKNVVNQQKSDSPASNARTVSTSVRGETKEPITPPYDVNDKYMGRKDEFLNLMTVSEIPLDFPLYEKQWELKDYNAVVDAYFMNHTDILKERAKQKVQLLIDQQAK